VGGQQTAAAMTFLIDGYNLIFECGLHGKRINAQTLSRGREKLLREIEKNLSVELQVKCTVVFDARKQMLSGQQERQPYGRIDVRFAVCYDDADSMIETLIAEHSAPKTLTVVSSDHRVQRAAVRRKARTVDSGDWFDQLLAGTFRNRIHNPNTDRQTEDAPNERLLTDKDLEEFNRSLGDDIASTDGGVDFGFHF
jgi:hypothetical protein